MPPVEREDDSDWCAIDDDGKVIGDDAVDEEAAPPVVQNSVAPEDAIPHDSEFTLGSTGNEPAVSTEIKNDQVNVDQEMTPSIENLEVSEEEPAASSIATDIGNFFQGDKVMFVTDNDGAKKARIVAVEPPVYRIELLDGNGETMTIPVNYPGLLSLGEYESQRLTNETATMRVISTIPYGGKGGGLFDDLTNNASGTKRITEIHVFAGAVVDGIGARYSDGTTSFYGGQGGGKQTLALTAGEYITEVVVRHGKLVQALTFMTNRNRTFGPWGGTGGFTLGLTASTTTLRAPDRHYALAAIHGRSGKYLDAFGAHWAPIAAEVGTISKKDVVHTLEKQQLLKSSDLYGDSSSGLPFDDGHYNIHLTNLTVMVEERDGSVIRGVSARYFTGREETHGGLAGRTKEVTLAMNREEWVTAVHVHADDQRLIRGLKFVTNKGRMLGPCGDVCETNGTDVLNAPSDYMLIGLKGLASDNALNALGFNWSPAPKGR